MRLVSLLPTLLGCSLLASCSPASPPEDCPPPHPTFRLTVTCLDGPVPADVAIRVVYGGGVEEFRALHEADPAKSVFCRLQYVGSDVLDAAADVDTDASVGGEISAVVCELWTDGPASVRVQASGYPPVDRELAAERDDCGLKLTETAIALERPD